MNGCRAMRNPSIQYNNKLDMNGKKNETRIVIFYLVMFDIMADIIVINIVTRRADDVKTTTKLLVVLSGQVTNDEQRTK